MGNPRTGNGHTGGQKPSWRDLFMRRSAKDNTDVTGDIQELATSRFRKAAGAPRETPRRGRSRWFN